MSDLLKHKIIPPVVFEEIRTALSFFPQLNEVPIRFKFKDNIKKSTMLAQPAFVSFFKSRKYRSYNILISKKFKISRRKLKTEDIPSDVFIGWIGHELGHLLDYERMTKWQLIKFGFKYLFFDKHIIVAETQADTFAIYQGMKTYIIKTKRFILYHPEIPEHYKDRIKRYYLSPEEVMQIAADKNQDNDYLI